MLFNKTMLALLAAAAGLSSVVADGGGENLGLVIKGGSWKLPGGTPAASNDDVAAVMQADAETIKTSIEQVLDEKVVAVEDGAERRLQTGIVTGSNTAHQVIYTIFEILEEQFPCGQEYDLNLVPIPVNAICYYIWELEYKVSIIADRGYHLGHQTAANDILPGLETGLPTVIQDVIKAQVSEEWVNKQSVISGFNFKANAYGVYDDPHFKTWSGVWYDFMGACDLKLLHAPFFGENALDINIRTKIRYDYSYVESAVLKLGDDTFEVASFGDYFLNGIGNAEMPTTFAGYPVVHTTPSKKLHIFEIQMDTEKITLKAFKDMVTVILNDVNVDRFRGSLGMLGEVKTGRMVARDGATLIEDPNAFADEWQIRVDEPMLFDTVNGPQAPEKCKLPNPTAAKGRRLGETIALEAAIKACEMYASVDYKDACVHDVMATGDLDLAAAGAF